MKRYMVYAEEIKKLYVEVEANNQSEAFLKALKKKDYEFEFVQDEEPKFIVLASNIHEVMV